jgi:hypothetical protein
LRLPQIEVKPTSICAPVPKMVESLESFVILSSALGAYRGTGTACAIRQAGAPLQNTARERWIVECTSAGFVALTAVVGGAREPADRIPPGT